jgi:glucose/mannose-6-phosphate isomerase
MMLKELSLWETKLKEGVQLAQSFYDDHAARLPKNITKIAFVGMGGSGIAGRIFKTFIELRSPICPIIVESTTLPASIDNKTLAIVMSYSGNTWETLDVLDQLTAKFIPTIVVAHGGKAIKTAEAKDLPFILMPDSLTPRSSLGHSLGFLGGLFGLMGVLPSTAWVQGWIKDAEKLVPALVDPVFFKDFLALTNGYDWFHIWGIAGDSAAAAYRATTQFNENAKIQAVFNTFPELAHNLLVGVGQAKTPPFILCFQTDFLSAHMAGALQAVTEILKEKRAILYKTPVLGDTFESQVFTAILWADFASYHLAKARGVDVEPVQIIDEFKKRQKLIGI